MYRVTIFFFILIICSCRKEEKELPPATVSGAGTFGCLVNEEVWVPDRGTLFVRNLDYSFNKGSFNIYARKKNKVSDQSISVNFNNSIFSTGIYLLEDNDLNGADFHDSNRSCFYETDSIPNGKNKGQLVISRLDTINRIISGTFEFTSEKQGCRILKVRDGRFDFKYN